MWIDVADGAHGVRGVREHWVERYHVDGVETEAKSEFDGYVHHDYRVLHALFDGSRVGFAHEER